MSNGSTEERTDDVQTPRSSLDDVLDVYRRDLDWSLIRENLKLDPDARSRKFEDFMLAIEAIRGAARRP